jgi:mono/diheme cytochrome c family protein
MKTTQQTIKALSIIFLGLTFSQNVFAYSTGITGYSGNPAAGGGNTCASCHSGGVAPTVSLTGPTTVQPGTINSYTLIISGGQAHSGGLDVSLEPGAGTLVNTQSSTKLQSSEITHTARKSAIAGEVIFTFDWQAPTTVGTYTIYSSGLSTNGNSNTTGDAVSSITTAVSVSAGAPQPPTAQISAPQSASVNQTVTFDGSGSYDPDGTIVSYAWDFGDGHTSTGAVTINTFTAAGTYTVTLTVTDADGLSNTTFVDITVGGVMIPVANPGGPYTGTEGQPVTFDGSQSSHTSAIVRYIWDFGDGTAAVESAVPTISHTYTQAGAYTLTLAVQDAAGITGVDTTTVVIEGIAPPIELDGPTLYASNCAGCHNALATSTKKNRTATQIQSAINTVSQMSGLSGLLPEQIQAIANALVDNTPQPTDGPTLYANNCSGCHGPLATSTKKNRTATQIQGAINSVSQMSGLSGLSTADVQAIADALVDTTPQPSDGATLYTNNCSSCHGPLATSSKLNKTASQIQSAISTVSQMSGLSGLTIAQVQAIADALVSSTPQPTDGPTLYANNCAGCHGPLATSTKKNRTATQIQGAINSISQMSGLSSLTAAEVQAIAEALVDTTPQPTDGATLYANNCSSCHGPLATSSKLNRTATQIQNAINTVGQMSGLSGLTTAEVQAIADALVSSTPAPTTGEGLYNSYCLVCHGAEGRGGQYENVRGSSTNEIASAINSVSLMNSLSSLSSSQLQLIAGYLSGSTPTPTVTGGDLYNAYCLACHGVGGRGGQYESVRGASSSEISSALSGVNLMRSINLTSSQIRSISDYLNGVSGTAPSPTPTDGPTLYTTYCSGCHGPLATSSKLGRTATQIQNAINSNTGGMGTFSTILSAANIQAIADALGGGGTGGGTGGGGTTLDGATLYTNNCSGCHGQLANSTKLNRTATQIQNAINTVGSMNGINLTTAEIQAIADALASTNGGGGTTTTGESLYVSMCQGCHGFNGTGGSAKAIVGVSATQITNAVSNVSAMRSLTVTTANAQDIATFLSSGGGNTTEPTTGPELYAIKCQACHGAGGYGGPEESVRGASASSILSAISSVSAMQPIPLTTSQAQAISSYLNGTNYGGGGEGGGGD